MKFHGFLDNSKYFDILFPRFFLRVSMIINLPHTKIQSIRGVVPAQVLWAWREPTYRGDTCALAEVPVALSVGPFPAPRFDSSAGEGVAALGRLDRVGSAQSSYGKHFIQKIFYRFSTDLNIDWGCSRPHHRIGHVCSTTKNAQEHPERVISRGER